MMRMSFTWTLVGHGWADCTVADDQHEAEATASFITAAPEDLLTAVTRLILGERETRTEFEAEPTTFLWVFHRAGDDVGIRLLQSDDGRCKHAEHAEYAEYAEYGEYGTEIWASRQTTSTLARAFIRGFDAVAHTYGESGYHDKWGSPFPRTELEALRTAWRAGRGPQSTAS